MIPFFELGPFAAVLREANSCRYKILLALFGLDIYSQLEAINQRVNAIRVRFIAEPTPRPFSTVHQEELRGSFPTEQ